MNLGFRDWCWNAAVPKTTKKREGKISKSEKIYILEKVKRG